MTIIALTGDSIVQRRLLSKSDGEVKPLFDIIREADVAFTNLEVLPNDYRGDPALDSGGSHFGAPSWILDELVEAGFDMFATATNHSLDYSISGLEYVLDQLDSRRLCHAGCGRDLEEARQVSYFTTSSATVSMPPQPFEWPTEKDPASSPRTPKSLLGDIGKPKIYKHDYASVNPIPDVETVIVGLRSGFDHEHKPQLHKAL